MSAGPPVLYRTAILPAWIDYNGHMNVAYYVLVFDKATDALLDRLGIGEAYRRDTGRTCYALEGHVTWKAELKTGEEVRVETTLVAADEKRLHVFHRMLRDADGAVAAARRMLEWSVGAGVLIGGVLLALIDVVPRAFTTDAAVIERAHAMWPLFCAMWPPAAIVFALDGILIGAGDARYLAGAMVASAAVFVPLAIAALAFGWGIVGVWCAVLALMAMRLATLAVRFAGRRWALVGAAT
jgi:acyl-CoA thioesterase FadM